MHHVDDGTLHALLDGALHATDPEGAAAAESHLEGCAECRRRLESAADVRDRAGAILGALEPEIRPDFEEVLVRAGGAARATDLEPRAAPVEAGAAAGAGPARVALQRQARRTRGVAWAATVVIALGTGYLIRDRVVPERARQESVPVLEARDAAAPSSVAADGTQPEEEGEDRAGSTEAAGLPGTERQARLEATGQTGSDHGPDGGARESVRARAPLADAAPGNAEEAPVTMAEESVVAGVGAPAPLGRPVPSGEPVTRVPPDGADGMRVRRLVAGQPAESSAAVALEALEVTGAALADEPANLAFDGDWRPGTMAEAAGLLGGPLYILPNADPFRVELHGEALAARSLQRLPSGIHIVVVQRTVNHGADAADDAPAERAVSPPAARPAPAPQQAASRPTAEREAISGPPHMETARFRGPDYELVVTGPLPADVLRAMAQEARPAPPAR